MINGASDLSRLRRIALAAQGLAKVKTFGNGLQGAREAISHLGYVQIDSISVVERAHHHVLFSRVPKFKPAMTEQLLIDKDIFEYWSHAAAFLPMADFCFSLPYKRAISSGQVHWYKDPDQKLMAELLARIRSDGPLRARDLEAKKTKVGSAWWDWKPAKKALEQLYMQGDLMVRDREGFQKKYDLTERVLPSSANTAMPSLNEFAEYLIEQQLRSHGMATLKGISYLRRNPQLRKAIKTRVNERLAQGDLEQIIMKDGSVFIIWAGAFDCALPRITDRLHILSPFDNLVIQRERLKTLFDFDYQIECYVPEAKRQYGYFCLPLLFRNKFIGRMDCKVHRKEQHLEIKSLYLEPALYDDDALVDAFKKAIIPFSQFQQCASISLTAVRPKQLAQRFRQVLA